MELRTLIDQWIEEKLELQINQFDYSKQTIIEIGQMIESMFSRGLFMLGNSYLPVLELIIHKLKSKEYKVAVERAEAISYYQLFEVAVDYYHLRDYIYYSYAKENSIEWQKNGEDIYVRVHDKSIFRQLVHNSQILFLNSSKMLKDNVMSMENILLALKNQEEFDFNNEKITDVLNSIEQETKIKMKSFFSYIPFDSEISFGKYTYCEFIAVYTELLENSLYRRYYSYANNLSSVIVYEGIELSSAISQVLQIEQEKIVYILMDISKSSRGTFIYIEQDNIFIMYLTSFSLLDGITNMLKYYANTNSNGFLTNFAEPIGQALVDSLEQSFIQFKNFRCIKEKKLNKYSQLLPDIDLLALSYEPSLGFHAYVCEVKNGLIPIWAKDYLKALGKKGYLEKALSQITCIEEFFNTNVGQEMLYESIMEKFSFLDFEKLFPRGFCVLVEFLIVTSENIGVLCEDCNKSIVSASIIKEIIEKSDGDVTYIQECLSKLNETMDSCLEVKCKETILNGIKVKYEVCSSNALLKLDDNYFLSCGMDKEIEENALETGYSFIDGFVDEISS